MAQEQQDKAADVEEVDMADTKWQSGHVDERDIPAEQRRAEARVMYVYCVFLLFDCDINEPPGETD
jgi:hypothetical protein